MKRVSVLLIAGSAWGSSASADSVLYANGAWVAIDRGVVCEAATRSLRLAVKGKIQALAGFSFTPDHRRWGEFYSRLSRVSRPGSSAILKIGDQPFLLVVRGDWAWSRGPLQEQAIMAAARNGGAMRIEARDQGGNRFVDPYLLDGAPTAIDSAAARCALRAAGKVR